MASENSKKLAEFLEFELGERLGKSVRYHIVGWAVDQVWPWETVWQMKWKWTSMRLVRPWKVKSLESRMAPWLSQNKLVGKEKEKIEENSVSSLWIQMMSFDEWVSATYSASVLDKVIIGCFFKLQETKPIPTKNVNLEIEWRWIWEAQSESEYLTMVELRPLRTNLNVFVPDK